MRQVFKKVSVRQKIGVSTPRPPRLIISRTLPVSCIIIHLSFILHMSVPRRWLGVLRWSEVAAEVT